MPGKIVSSYQGKIVPRKTVNKTRQPDATAQEQEANALTRRAIRTASGAPGKPPRAAARCDSDRHPATRRERTTPHGSSDGTAVPGSMQHEPKAPRPSDADLTQSAILALEQHGFAADDQIKVIIKHGRLILEGTVDTPLRKRAATAAVKGLDGIRSIRNHIVFTNDTLAQRVHQQIIEDFMFDAQVEACRIVVLAYDQTIVLTGSTRSETKRKQAEAVAWEVPGTEAVLNPIPFT
jgi:osmotically-inducible protein OsmY